MGEANNNEAIKSLLVSICFQNQHSEATNRRGASILAEIMRNYVDAPAGN